MIENLKEALVLTYDSLTHPKETLLLITKEQRLYEGLVIWFLTILLTVFSVFAQWERSSVMTVIGIYFGAALFLLLRMACLHGTSYMLGGKGSIKGLLAALCFADIPMNLATLAESFVFLLPEEIIHIISLIAGIWSFVLLVMAIMANYRLSVVKSVLAIILPVIIVTGCIVLFFIYIAVSVVTWIPGL